MKKNKLYKISNIITIISSLMFFIILLSKNNDTQKVIFNLILSIIFVLILIFINRKIYSNYNEINKKNEIIIISLFSIINISLVYILSCNFMISLVILFINYLIYYIIRKLINKKSALFSLILLLFSNILIFNSDIILLLSITTSLFIYNLIDNISIKRKINKIIFGTLGILMALSIKIDIFSIIIFVGLFIDMFFSHDKKYSLKLITISIIVCIINCIGLSFIVNINIFEKIFVNSFNIQLKNNQLCNIIELTLILSVIINYLKMIQLEDENKYSYLNISMLLIFVISLFFNINVINFLPVIIFEACSGLYLQNFKKYTNIYKEKHLKKKIKNVRKVSVVIPNYNYEKYIIERIDSVLLQTYPIYELIILDDKSTDNSVEVINKKIQEIKQKYPNLIVKFIPNEVNSGNVFKQWKKAFQVSTGDYLWIAEADDSCSNVFLQEIMQPFNDEKVIMSYCESLTMNEKNRIIMRNLRPWIDIFKTGKWNKSFIEDGNEFASNFICINNTIANVSSLVFKKIPSIDYNKYLTKAEEYKLAGDWYFYEKLLKYGKIAYNCSSLNYHRMHDNSVTLTTKREKEYEEICSIQDDIISNYKLTESMKNKINKRRTIFQNNFGFSEEELKLSKINFEDILKKYKIKENILLSIIIPVYNTEPYLEKCLNSIMNGLPSRTEIIIINDGSPDNSEKIIKKFEKKYPEKIKYYKKQNGGLSNTKNFGLSKAKGKYIGFVDSDDYIKSNMFDTMLKKAIIEDADIVYCDVEMIFEDGTTRFVNSTNYDTDDNFMRDIDTPLMPASWSKIAKRELFENLTYPEGYNNEDIAVSPVLFARSKKTVKINTAFYKYLQRTGSIQNSGFSEKRFVAFYTSKLCFSRIANFSKDKQEKIKGAIYTHQLLALLLYPIADCKNKDERLNFITLFCEKINEFNDYDTNKYVKKYLKDIYKEELIDLLKKSKIRKINKIIRK